MFQPRFLSPLLSPFFLLDKGNRAGLICHRDAKSFKRDVRIEKMLRPFGKTGGNNITHGWLAISKSREATTSNHAIPLEQFFLFVDTHNS